jgi:hypothetical protein
LNEQISSQEDEENELKYAIRASLETYDLEKKRRKGKNLQKRKNNS